MGRIEVGDRRRPWSCSRCRRGLSPLGGLACGWRLEGCQRWAALRGIELAAIPCPRYVGEHAVLEMYNFSLSKHHAMHGVLFAYFAVYGRSREVINLGFAYFAIAMA